MRLNSPLFSIITPVFRSELTLPRTLDSLMAQSERSWQAIVIDDGSPDGSWKVAEGFAYFDPRFVPLRQANAGAGAARNVALSHACGEFVMFLDADDWLEPAALSLLLAEARRGKCDLVHGAFRYMTNDGWRTDWTGAYQGNRPLFEALCGSNVLSMPAAVIARRTAVEDVGGFDPSLKNCGDWDLWGRLARRRGNIGRVDACVANYRMRPSSLSHNPHTLLRDAMRTIERMHAVDDRVRDASPDFYCGGDPADLPSRRVNFTLYTVGLALGANEVATAASMLDTVRDWPELYANETAGFLFSGICFARCQGPDGAAEFWPAVAASVREIVRTMGSRTGQSGLGEKILSCLHHLSGEPLPPAQHSQDDRPLAQSA
jgi:glycosyltransferase involved in cell wall biosynthesis